MARRRSTGESSARERGETVVVADGRGEAEPRASRAHYDSTSGRIVVELRNGCVFAFPPALGEGLEGGTPEEWAEVEVEGDGYGLHWESLDADLTVPGLLLGQFGTRRWMSELGRRGGRRSTPQKARAARENGRKGGRPRGPTPSA